MVPHFTFYGDGDKLHAPLATLLPKKLWNEKVAKEPKSSQIKILEPTASKKSQIYVFWLQKSQSGNPVSGASRSRFFPDGRRVHFPTLPTCLVVYVQKSDFHLINVFCVVIVIKKRKLLCLAQVVFSYFVLHSNKIPLAACCSDSQMELIV